MRILVIGATGTIGQAIVRQLEPEHEVLPASRHSHPLAVDMTNSATVQELLQQIQPLDAIICPAGETRLKPLATLTDEVQFCVQNKLLG